MNIDNTYANHYAGQQVSVVDDADNILFAGIITKIGSINACINDSVTGHNYDVPYSMIYAHNTATTKQAFLTKQAQAEIISETEKEGKQFVLVKNESNIDGSLSVAYEVRVDDAIIWESETITTNVYDVENGWSAPDDFDDNKLDLIQQSAEAGFDMVVDSYTNMISIVEESAQVVGDPLAEGAPGEVAIGEPAFAEDAAELGGGGGATMIGGDADIDMAGEEGEVVGEDGSAGDVVDAEAESAVGGPEAFGQEPVEVVTSLERPSFARSIISSTEKTSSDDRLHGNPQHRLNPALRNEMENKGIDSGNTNDIELSEKLKDFDYEL